MASDEAVPGARSGSNHAALQSGVPAAQAAVSSFQAVNTSTPSSTPQLTGTPDSGPIPTKSTADAAPADVTMAESSYGTRSRNRTSARPNYSEEQEMDFEYASPPATSTRKRASEPAASTSHGVVENKRPNEVNGTAANGSNGVSATTTTTTTAKDATSALAGAGAPGNPKKRKAPGASAANAQAAAAAATAAAASTPPPTTTRRVVPTGSALWARDTNLMTFSKSTSCLSKKGELIADDGTRLSVNDHVYLVCEPPGEPYYVCRIMEFLHVVPDDPFSPVDSLKVNWYYRPRDIQRFSSDTRLVYATMHSDTCPITSLRGKCSIKHKSEIDGLEEYRKQPDAFYFVQAFDRWIRRSYEIIPVQQIINVPDRVKTALNENWKFVVVEIGRVKELTSAAKTCKRCARYCASNDSVDCAICKNSYHMNCVQPPLPKKPSRGFAWACGPCSRESERKFEARNTPTPSGNEAEEEVVEEEEQPAVSNDTTRAPSPSPDDMDIDHHPATEAEIAAAKQWPMRYLGIHARLEDALQYDERSIYPRASSRLGPRHQANVNVWHGRPVELVKTADIKKRYTKGGAPKKEGKLSKEAIAALEEERAKRPKWVQDEPQGYVARGEDYPNEDPRCTAKRMFIMPSEEETPKKFGSQGQNEFINDYISNVKPLAKGIGVPPFGTNFLDKALELLTTNKYKAGPALEQLKKVNRQKDLHEPVISRADLNKFEEGVAKYGSEHRLIRLHMKTNLPHSDIVRFYYLWKKTAKGKSIWGNYPGRKKRKIESDTGAKLQAEVADEGDDSAFDNERAARKSRGFQCKFCQTNHSRRWRRAPGVSAGETVSSESKSITDDDRDGPLLALCLRCAILWRKYAIQWEDAEDMKKVAQGGGKAIKKRLDEELVREIFAASEAAQAAAQQQASAGTFAENGEPAKKKSKMEKDATVAAAEALKKKEKPLPPPKEPTPPPPPIIPAQPTWKILPCAVCKGTDNTIACQHCQLTVHRKCFGLRDNEGIKSDGGVKWICEQCQNDRNPTVSTDYACCLCLTEETQIDLVEPPRVSHKKKTDREREKERLEKELADEMRARYRSQQASLNRPLLPREPLKCTTGNNWVHVYCAMWAPEIRFSNAKTLQVAEGFQLIPPARFDAVCKLCRNKDHQNRVRENAGACINCSQCNASFHASCAFEQGYQFGFDVAPVKGSRKDQVTTATLGQETGSLTAIVLCKEHVVKSIVHPINEVVDENGTTALQVYAQNYKQADLALTGTVRKAQLAQQTKDKGQQSVNMQTSVRRESGAHAAAAAARRGPRTSSFAETKAEQFDGANGLEIVPDATSRRCINCEIDVTPRWHRVPWSEEPTRHLAAKQIPTAPASGGDGDQLSNGEDQKLHASSGAVAPPPTQQKQQNIRFMAPGASGRAWEGMPERHGARPNGDRAFSDAQNATPPSDAGPAPQTNGEHRLPFEELNRAIESEYHGHALPHYQTPSKSGVTTSGSKEHFQEKSHMEWLCHKCFLKKKLVPTPPPEENLESKQLDNKNKLQQTTAQSIEQQFKVWDEPPQPAAPRQSIPPPPLNGYLPPGGPPAYLNGPPQYGQPAMHLGHIQPPPPEYYHHQMGVNGHHTAQPSMHPQQQQQHLHHDGHPPMHERHNSYGYQPQHSPAPSPYASMPHHHHNRSLNGYSPHAVQAMPNGLHNQHAGPSSQAPPMQSPTYPPPLQAHAPHHQQIPPLRQDPGYPSHLSPIGAPEYSRPDAMFGRARSDQQQQQHAHPAPHQPHQPPHLHQHQAPPQQHQYHGPPPQSLPAQPQQHHPAHQTTPSVGPIDPSLLNPPSAVPATASAPQSHQAQPSQGGRIAAASPSGHPSIPGAGMEHQISALPPATPRTTSAATSQPAVSGASNSPSLANLLS